MPTIRLPRLAVAANRQPIVGERHEAPCPRCGGNADATYMLDRHGRPGWVIGCFTASCRDLEGRYLVELADALGLKRGVSKEQIVTAFVQNARPSMRSMNGPERPPSEAVVAGWMTRLNAPPDALAYLHGRGLTDNTLGWSRLGYGSFHGRPLAFMFPVTDAQGTVVGLKERYWPAHWIDAQGKRRKTRSLAGRGSHLYPDIGDGKKVILCAGEFDCLVVRQHFDAAVAVTSTAGTSLRDDQLQDFEGREVAVIYDVGEEVSARRNAQRLRDAGVDAWAVALPLPGHGDDLNDWFVRDGRTKRSLKRVIREDRSRSCL